MISEVLTREMNEQIKFELYSAYMYLAMSADCSNRNLSGFAHWLSQQAEEEIAHAMRFYNFLLERGAQVELMAIDQPPARYGSPLEIMEKSLEHERFVTSRINGLYKLALSEGDYPAQVLLQWFESRWKRNPASMKSSSG